MDRWGLKGVDKCWKWSQVCGQSSEYANDLEIQGKGKYGRCIGAHNR